jgi:nucleoside-diphosphate-sugar epimerase
MTLFAGSARGLNDTTGVVTGASGFMGRAVLAQLPSSCRVYATYNSARDFPQWAQRCAADVRPVRIDLQTERLDAVIPPVDWGLLMAARVATAASRRDPIGELRAVSGVVFNSVARLRAQRLLLLSSGSVYETLSGELTPSRVPEPRLPYAIAKLAGEHLFRSYAEAPYWVIRFFGAFGPGEPSFKLARRLTETFARGARSFELSGDGTNVIDPLYIDEAAARIACALEAPGESRVVNLSQGEWLTVREFAEQAYLAAHPAPGGAPLELQCSGAAHELMRGRARSDAAIWRSDLDHLTVGEGFQHYAAALRGD